MSKKTLHHVWTWRNLSHRISIHPIHTAINKPKSAEAAVLVQGAPAWMCWNPDAGSSSQMEFYMLSQMPDSDLFWSLSVFASDITGVCIYSCRQIPRRSGPRSTAEVVNGKAALRRCKSKHACWIVPTCRSCVWGRLTCFDRKRPLQQKNRLFPVGLRNLRTRGEHHLQQ